MSSSDPSSASCRCCPLLDLQANQIQHLQQQIELMQSTQAGALGLAQAKASELEELARMQQAQLRDAHATILDLQTRLLESEAALGVAEQAATAAATEMGALHQVRLVGRPPCSLSVGRNPWNLKSLLLVCEHMPPEHWRSLALLRSPHAGRVCDHGA